MVIGRQPGSDLLLTEDLVSRRHARISYDGREVTVEDLGSTNGTYVNGKRIERSRVVPGDRVLVGESIFTLAVREPSQATVATEVRSVTADGLIAAGKPSTAMQGRLDEVPLPDLLQLLGTARKSGVLALHTEGHVAEVRLDRGRIVGCSLDTRADLPPQKVLFRLFHWTTGGFELRPSAPAEAPPAPIAEPTDVLIMQAARYLDEMRSARSALPSRFTVRDEGGRVVLDESDRSLVALATRPTTLEAVLDATSLPDLAAAERLVALHARGVLVPDRTN
jgi:hypothetical protein